MIPDPATKEMGHDLAAAASVAPLTMPALFVAADSASLAAQRRYKRLVGAELALLIGSAALSTVQAWLPEDALSARWDRALAAVLLALAVMAKLANREATSSGIWFNGRAVAETVKSSAWRYAVRAEPFDGPDGEAEADFLETLDEALLARMELARSLTELPAGRSQIPPDLRTLRAAPLETRRAVYLSQRLDDQIGWYSSKSRAHASAAGRWYWISLGFQTLALVLAILMVAETSAPDVVGLLATLAVAATAWTQLNRNDELAKSYGMAAYELTRMRTRVEIAPDEAAFSRAVDGAEDAVSREHTMWMAKRN